jgi:hypothetical protein
MAALGAAITASLPLSTASALPPGSPAESSPTINLSPSTGNQGTNLTLSFSGAAYCQGDTSTNGYFWQTFLVSNAVDAGTLTFDGGGPVGIAGQYVSPLYQANDEDPVVNRGTAAATASGGQLTGFPVGNNYKIIPNTGGIPNGVYKLGFACALAGQTTRYWQIPITITNSTGAAGGFTWTFGAVPPAPVLAPLTVGDGQLSGSFTLGSVVPALSASGGLQVLYTPQGGSQQTIDLANSATTFIIPGLSNFTSVDVQIRATNSVGSTLSNTRTATPVPAAAGAPVLTATGVANGVDLSWTAPAGEPASVTRTSYSITVTAGGSPIVGSPFSAAASATTLSLAGLTPGTAYSAQVTALYTPAAYTGTASNIATATALANTIITQSINVDRPNGSLVLTQVCGVSGALPAEPGVPTQFPTPLGALSATTTANGFSGPTAPTVAGGGADPAYPLYPDTIDIDATGGLGAVTANYPTNCGVDLGTGDLIVDPNSPLEGLYFAASGRLNQVTVTQTSNTDVVWAVTGSMSTFTRNGSSGVGQDNSFPGSYLGWTPVVNDRSTSGSLGELSGLFPADDPDGTAATPQSWNYRQNVEAGAAVQPDIVSSDATTSTTGRGLAVSRTLARVLAVAGTGDGTGADTQVGGLGIAKIDARLKLLIPVSADAGTYSGVLTFTVI